MTSRTDQQIISKPRLVVFDVEGVLIPKRRYLLFEASQRLSLLNFIKMLWAGFLYEVGLVSLKSALQKIFKQLRGLALEDLFQLYKKVPLIPNVKEVFEKLKKAGCKTALISSGLPQLFLEHLAAEMGVDYAVGLNLEVDGGYFTGRISGDVLERNGKALALEKIVEKEGLSPKDCVLVADDRNNLSMFKFCALRIGYNPDFLMTAKSDVVVKGDLREILTLINEDSPTERRRSLSKPEFIRETIHIGSFLVPFVSAYLSLSHFFFVFLIFVVTVVYVGSELARVQGFNIPVTSTITWNAAIMPEIYEFVTAPIFFAAGIILALVVFPIPESYAAIAVLTLGDGFASLFGKKLGRHVFPYNRGKMVEGTFFGFLFAFVGAWLFVDPLKALIGAAVGMLVETLPTPINDNLTIPLISGLVLLVVP
jgi:HAD superfamily phosphoserine phosphatase-like hydrolase